MLTGDNRAVADAVGTEAGVTQVCASQLPEDKVRFIKTLLGKGHCVGMLGDGVNDAPSLASASVGIVMGAIGSGVAMEAADVALMGDDLNKLPQFLRICRRTTKRIITNITLSMLLNFTAIILAGFGLLTPVTAAIVHNFGSVFVVVSSALLLAYKE
jgi:P-type E1-E2 ATPase